MAETRPYIFYDSAISICSTCLRRVEAKLVLRDGEVWMHKRCPEHGGERVLMADDAEYYRRAREVFLKPSEMPRRFQTKVEAGCPYDCGLCPDHEQHSCLSIIEVGDGCNLSCPVCYAGSGPHRMFWHPLARIEAMLDAVVASEGEPDVVQISGGEPTLHPDFWPILDAAKARPIRHLMLNTNGIRITQDEGFAERLAQYMPGFEVYLQFDSLRREPQLALRGADLRRVREQAIEKLNRLGLSTTLVVTLRRGLNDDEIGGILEYAVQQPAVRGVTFQPIQDAGRNEGYDAARDRLTLTEVRRRILEQTGLFQPADLLPVPCHSDALAMGYGLKTAKGFVPLTGLIDEQTLIEGSRNSITFENNPELRQAVFEAFATNHSPESGAASLKSLLLCCLPKIALPKSIGYKDLFRVILMRFQDAHDFDLRSVKKSCVHIVHPGDLRIIPFDTYNLFYRGDLEQRVLAPLRQAAQGAFL
ncbi:MAG: radical SAM protein [Planctomycetota bacterium]